MQETTNKWLYRVIGVMVALIVVISVFAFGKKIGIQKVQSLEPDSTETQTMIVEMRAEETQTEAPETEAAEEPVAEEPEPVPETVTVVVKETVLKETVVYREAEPKPAPAPSTTAAPVKRTYTLTLYADGGTSEVVGSGKYAAGDTVTVTARPLYGYAFRNWTSSDSSLLASGTAQTYRFTMPAGNVSLKCNTYMKPTVEVVAGRGVQSVSGGGTYAVGESVKITACVMPGYSFDGWTSGGKRNSSKTVFTFAMPEHSVTFTATATPISYTVTVSRGEGIASVSGGGSYLPGQQVTVACQASSGYRFARWASSDANAVSEGKTETYSFRMPAQNVKLTAKAEKTQYTLTLVRGVGIASVSGGGTYAPGRQVTVTCTLESNRHFSRWASSDTSAVSESKSQTYTFTMPAKDVKLTAKTYNNDFTVTLAAGTGIDSVHGGGTYKSGNPVTVDCTPSAGYVFTGWQSDNTSRLSGSTEKNYSFAMPYGDVKLTAKAEKTQYTVTLVRGSGIASAVGGGSYAPGETVTVYATCEKDYSFEGWTNEGSTVGVRSAYTFTMPNCDVVLHAAAMQINTGNESLKAAAENDPAVEA